MNCFFDNNMQSKELLMNRPEIYTYTVYGFIFSIIQEKDMPWVYSNLIQIMYHYDWQMLIFEKHIDMLENCPFLETHNIGFFDFEEPFADTIIHAIDNNYYVYLFLDWYYTNPKVANEHFAHNSIISGYNLSKNTFIVYDNYDNGRFVKKELDIDLVTKAFFSAWTSSNGNRDDNDGTDRFSYLKVVTFIKYRNSVEATLDYNNIMVQLNNYVCSRKSFPYLGMGKSLFGIMSYKSISDRITDGANNLIRDFHFLYEHKILMLKCLKYLFLKLDLNVNLLNDYQQVCEGFLLLRNKYIKDYYIKKQNSSQPIQEFLSYLNFLIEQEKNIISKILQTLDNDYLKNIFNEAQ